jgi:predicted phage terminase large subunit-like protein
LDYCTDTSNWPQSGWIRVWDLAHSDGLVKTKSDYTGGTLLNIVRGNKIHGTNDYFYDLYIADYKQIRATSAKRNSFIRSVAEQDTPSVKVIVEQSLDTLDAINDIKDMLKGRYSVNGLLYKAKKAVRIEPVLPLFEGGRVHIKKADWNNDWLDQIVRFDGSEKSHDEAVDNISLGWKYFDKKRKGGYQQIPYIGIG